ncbi:MAG: CpXC domain-containing protein [Lentisphaeria bacterium]|nr:CpXC domain-containing protein [Lentisphaeria bacterium]
MSKQQFQCPDCNEIFTLEDTVFMEPESDQLIELYQGKLNLYACRNCGKQVWIDRDMVYKDTPRKKVIFYKADISEAQIDQQLDDVQDKLGFQTDKSEDQPAWRLTVNHVDFVEKIYLHIHEYDDRVIEYIKSFLFNHNPGLEPTKHDLRYDFSCKKQEELRFMAIDRKTKQAVFQIDFDLDDYHNLEDELLGEEEQRNRLHACFRGDANYVQVEDLVEQNSEADTLIE